MNRFIKATTILFILTILSKIIGFIRDMVLVSIYGASMTTDVYITSMRIPTTLFSIVTSALATTFIPKFYDIYNNKGKKESLNFTNNLINITLILSIILGMVAFIFAAPLVKVFAINFTGEKLDLAIKFTRILAFTILFLGINDILTCWLQIKENYNIPILMGIPYNIVIISSIIISSKWKVEVLAIGSFLAIMSKLIFQLIYAYKTGYRYKLYINLKDENIKEIIILLMPVLIGVGVGQLNSIIDSSLASTLGDGIITILNSASKLDEILSGLFITTIISIMYPVFSKLSNDKESEEFIITIRRTINIIIIIMIPIIVGVIILAVPIVRVLFERGKFDSNSTILTAQAMRCYALGILAAGIGSVISRIFYSLKDTKTPMINGTITIITNIVLNLIFIRYLGYIGLALATSLSYFVKLVLSFKKLKEKVNYFQQDLILKTFLKSFVAASIMGLVVCLTYNLLRAMLVLDTTISVLILIIEGIIGGGIYTSTILKMNIEEVDTIFNKVKCRFIRLFKLNKCS